MSRTLYGSSQISESLEDGLWVLILAELSQIWLLILYQGASDRCLLAWVSYFSLASASNALAISRIRSILSVIVWTFRASLFWLAD